ncbi:cyclic nucleotide-binding protein [marine bacterium AO1-C]|nr:cyclic nucleotide-binding protein [marine bacterium AO1-C]
MGGENIFSAIEWQHFASIWEPYSVKRKEIITHKDQKENYIYFVLGGVQRIYFASENGKEATLVFTYPNSFGGILDSFLLQKPSKYYYESLTTSHFLRAPHQNIKQAITNNSKLDDLFKQQTYLGLAGLLTRMVELQCFSAEEKFKKLLKRTPHILQLVPHKYLANYLGIDPTNFSKFLNNVKT